MTTRLHNYTEVRAYFEKEHPDWLRALTPRHINTPAEYWPQKVLAVSSVNAAMQNYVSIHEHQTRLNAALTAVQGQAASLLRYHVPIYYVSCELVAAAVRTELPDDMVFEAVPFPFDALVFMLPKGNVRHPTTAIAHSLYCRVPPKDRICPCRSRSWIFGLPPTRMPYSLPPTCRKRSSTSKSIGGASAK